jgi:hypothetical protein
MHGPRLAPVQRQRQARVQVRQLLACHPWQLAAHGQAAYIIHRAELGQPAAFLRTVQAVVAPEAQASWWQPWRRGMAHNVLLITREDG